MDETMQGSVAGHRRVSSGSPEDQVLGIDHLAVRYRNGGLGIVDVTVTVGPGEVVGLFGPNGAGKSTTVRAVSGFLRSEGARAIRGHVRLLGKDVTNREPHRQARMGLYVVPERDKVFPSLSVWENLWTLQHPPKGQRKAELTERVFTLFPALADRKRQMAGQLSGGQRQMLALARGILSQPKILVVDELSLGLHESTLPPLVDAIHAVASGGTSVLLVDESTKFALSISDYCYLLKDGATTAEGLPSDPELIHALSQSFAEVL